MPVRRNSALGRLADAARSGKPLLHVKVSPRFARFLIAAGARPAASDHNIENKPPTMNTEFTSPDKSVPHEAQSDASDEGDSWRKSSGSMVGVCVEVGHIGRSIAVRDTMNRQGPALVLSPDCWRIFTNVIRESGHIGGTSA
jgi:hypothetical protein